MDNVVASEQIAEVDSTAYLAGNGEDIEKGVVDTVGDTVHIQVAERNALESCGVVVV